MREEAIKLFSKICKTHSYWERKPLLPVLEIYRELNIKKREILYEFFCSEGISILAALMNGARVITGNLNPVAVFLNKVLIRPVNIATLKYFYNFVEQDIKNEIINLYTIKCPACKKNTIIDYTIWEGREETSKPVSMKIHCPDCGRKYIDIIKDNVKFKSSNYKSGKWYPKTKIAARNKIEVEFYYQLFTNRNLKALSLLLESISKIKIIGYKDALQYVFTSILGNCSEMHSHSGTHLFSFSDGAIYPYKPAKKRKEINVWQAFSNGFENFVDCKNYIYEVLPELMDIRITDSEIKFNNDQYDVLITKSDIFDPSYNMQQPFTYCFLNPPCCRDKEYMNYYQFWGSWLKMNIGTRRDYCVKKDKPEEYIRAISNVLNQVADKSKKNIAIVLFPDRISGKLDTAMNELIKNAGFFIHKKQTVISTTKSNLSDRKDNFYILRKEKYNPLKTQKMSDDQLQNKYINYCRAAAFLYYGAGKISIGNIEILVAGIMPSIIGEGVVPITGAELKNSIKDNRVNQRCYHSFCLALLDIIFNNDTLVYRYINEKIFNHLFFDLPRVDISDFSNEFVAAAFIVSDNHTDFIFCFSDQQEDLLEEIINKVNRSDKDQFKKICIVIERDNIVMREKRNLKYSGKWKRVFFVSFDDIMDRAEKIDQMSFKKLCAKRIKKQNLFNQPVQGVNTYYAEVLDNIPFEHLIDSADLKHYKLRFRVNDIFQNILPGQFVMIDTVPAGKKKYQDKSKRLTGDYKDNDTFYTCASPYLKRPFGIHRAYYEHFPKDYLKKIRLPKNLSLVLHTVYPYEFDVFYKVLERGIGTKNLSKIVSGDIIRIIAPLGSRYNLRELREQGIEEVHVIGGGVGMAPLVFLVQALRFFSFKIKAFVGISSIEFLKHSDDYYKHSFTEETKYAKIYYDDLIDIGLTENDIYISCEEKTDEAPGIKNLFIGNISDYYKQFLSQKSNGKGSIAFSCGPTLMMKEVNSICKEYKIPLKVLLEKRMACGIGVCFSCICQIKSKDGDYQNMKVCVDGPIFDAKDVKELNYG